MQTLSTGFDWFVWVPSPPAHGHRADRRAQATTVRYQPAAARSGRVIRSDLDWCSAVSSARSASASPLAWERSRSTRFSCSCTATSAWRSVSRSDPSLLATPGGLRDGASLLAFSPDQRVSGGHLLAEADDLGLPGLLATPGGLLEAGSLLAFFPAQCVSGRHLLAQAGDLAPQCRFTDLHVQALHHRAAQASKGFSNPAGFRRVLRGLKKRRHRSGQIGAEAKDA
jgi:hypothetical protein